MCMYMHFALCMFVFGNYRSSYVMVKKIREWKTIGNKGVVLRETRVHLYIHVYHVSKHN